MNATAMFVGLLIALFAVLLLRRSRDLKPRIARYGTQRMCPSCGLITSRLKACCMECGKSLAGVVYSTVEK
jgi:predicted amidophosphoribosyltransferase